MADYIYKYFPKGSLDLVFERNGFCGVKCSLPKDYNDPFELFLGVDLNIGPQALAIYRTSFRTSRNTLPRAFHILQSSPLCGRTMLRTTPGSSWSLT